MTETENYEETILESLRAAGLCSSMDDPPLTPLSGGISSAIYRVDLPDQVLCAKCALSRLRVDADWQAPIERSEMEARWFETVARTDPTSVPALIINDTARHVVFMEYLSQESHQLWKSDLMAGRIDLAFAGSVGSKLAKIHSATASRPDLADRFSAKPFFHALRVEPYLLTTAKKNPKQSHVLKALADDLMLSETALMHGDVSPKNILSGPVGPVFLDAETACYGDPAFDLAFCLNHLLLKGARAPNLAPEYCDAFKELWRTYRSDLDWENPEELERRTAKLLAGLMLARIDGKSPVEYLQDSAQQEQVRAFARHALLAPYFHLDAMQQAWRETLSG